MTKPRTPIARSKPPARVNRKRAAKRKLENFGSKAEWIRTLPCVVLEYSRITPDCVGEVEAAHARSRGAGGDSTVLVPMCQRHHFRQHTIGILSLECDFGISLAMAADLYEALWQAETLYDD